MSRMLLIVSLISVSAYLVAAGIVAGWSFFLGGLAFLLCTLILSEQT